MTRYAGGQNIYGVSIGVLSLDSRFPKPPGHIKNPSGLAFTVCYETVSGATVPAMINDPSPAFFAPFIEAAKRLQAEGVRAITGSCGFMALFQKELADAVNIPVFSSSLIQVPLLYHMTGCRGPVGVLTASRQHLTHKHFEAVGAGDVPVAVMGMEDYAEFSQVILENRRQAMDMDLIAQEILAAARTLLERNPDIPALVLECTDMAPFAHRIQQQWNIPVCDLTTLATMVHDIVVRRPYAGFMP